MFRKLFSAMIFSISLASTPLVAQPLAVDRPAVVPPVRPLSRAELAQREAQKLFGLAAVHERNNRLVEAMRTYEEAALLDPEAAPIHRSLVPLYLALDRKDDARSARKRALELEPDDAETALRYAQLLRESGDRREALAVLTRAEALESLAERPELQAQISFERGALHEEAGDFAAAAEAFRMVTKLLDNPAVLLETLPYGEKEISTQVAETWERLGRVLLRAKQADEAVEAFRAAQKKDPQRAPRLALNLAEVQRTLGRPRDALASLDEYLRTQPQGTEGYELKISLLQELNRGADVLPALEAASGRDVHNVALKLLLAREYRKARQPIDAERIYQKLLKETPSPEVYKGLFGLYKEDRLGGERALRMLDDAIKSAVDKDDKPKEEKPGEAASAANARAMLQVVREDAALVRQMLEAAHRQIQVRPGLAYQTRVMLASMAQRTRQLEIAERLYRSCFERPGGLRGIEQDVYGGLLRVLMQAHKYGEIVIICKQGLEQAHATNRVLFHIDLAHAYLHLDRLKEALDAATSAVNDASDKDRLLCRRVRVDILSQSERYSEAIAECQSLLREYSQPGEVRDIRSTLSHVYTLQKQFPKAEEQLQLILRDDGNDATANNDLGYLWADQNKNLGEAELMVRKALELDRQQRSTGTAVGLDPDRDNAAFVDSLGWVLFRKGDLAGARRELEKASELPGGNDDPVVWDHLGDVYARQGELELARKAWAKALALFEAGVRRKADPRYREIQQKLRERE